MTSQTPYDKTNLHNTSYQLSDIHVHQQSSRPQSLPNCQYCNSKKYVIHYGKRRTKAGLNQIYRCTTCERNFTIRALKYTQYSNHIIINAISTYNLGYTQKETINRINKHFKTNISQSVLSSWIKRYSDICTFNHLRNKYEIDPKDIIVSKNLNLNPLKPKRTIWLRCRII